MLHVVYTQCSLLMLHFHRQILSEWEDIGTIVVAALTTTVDNSILCTKTVMSSQSKSTTFNMPTYIPCPILCIVQSF